MPEVSATSLFSPMHVDAILSKGYWEEVWTTIDLQDVLASVKIVEEW
ncbi:hypothetical protein [Metabacillus iocasae]|uniref:Uncharacterized protein n=1 Tax=Priestia iocasae TaxID=2291674 RepID=A0ABS2QY03_9BACI|nr:hypothetical protein [Metabacillus iocasae]MBM7704365.1 hypothetical protein [Metabacillus iocasae]